MVKCRVIVPASLVFMVVCLTAFTLWSGEQSTGAKISTAPDWTADSDQAYAYFGTSVSSAGDVNGDGYNDVVVGAPGYDNDENNEGRAFVYPGSASGLSTTADWTPESDQIWGRFGLSVSSAGDLNGDGFDDVIVGAQYYDNGQIHEGRAFVYYGSAFGLSATADWTAESDQMEANFGCSVSSAGDVNGDGYGDVIVGAENYWNHYYPFQTQDGRAFVFHGSPSGLSTTADWTAESDQMDAEFGGSVSSAGDVNGDGYDDVIVGAHWYSNGQPSEGRAFVFHGSPSGLSTTADWMAESDQMDAKFGGSVSSAGDVNGDGYDDVIVGAYYSYNRHDDKGRAFVYHGSPSGLSTTADWTAESDQESARFAWSVASAGDVNGDGYDDVIVGAKRYDNGQNDEGRAFVYHGSGSGLSATADWTAESDQEDAYFGRSVSSAGDVNGDGADDVIVGASGYDNGQNSEGRAFVYHGLCYGCEIDGVCFGPDETDPANVCLFCDPDLDPSGWSHNDGALCDDGLFCNGNDVCYGGTCSMHAGDPCDPVTEVCNEATNTCDPAGDDDTGDDDTGDDDVDDDAHDDDADDDLSDDLSAEALAKPDDDHAFGLCCG